LKAASANKYLFCDTELIVTKIWSEVRFKRCDPWIIRTIREHPYDLFLLCNIDLPWEYDPLREHPEMRGKLFDLYYKELSSGKLPFFVISGSGENRVKHAMDIIDGFFLKH